ncbi:MAG: diguanylate cyclase [Terriglobales bacterium]
MVIATNPARSLTARFAEFMSLPYAGLASLLFATLLTAQIAAFLIFGTARTGSALAQITIVSASLLTLSCTWIAFRRAQGIDAVFWVLFAITLLILLVPTTIQVHDTLYDPDILADSTWRLLFCVYGAPILMMLFLSETHRQATIKSAVFLDLFQVAIVVALVYSSLFFFPSQPMSSAERLHRDIGISDAQSFLLLVAVFVRLQFAHRPSSRKLLLRLGLFLLTCAVVTTIGDWIDLHNYPTAAVWFSIGWTLPQVVAGLIAITWTPQPEPLSAPEPAKFLSFLGINLALVAMLVALNLLMDRWKQAYGAIFTDTAIAASLLAFTLRLALTQYHQQQEIFERKAAQDQLSTSNKRVSRLLEDSRRQTAEITQISELGSLLQACASREEVFRLIPERLRRLFPDASGSVSLLTASKARLETVAPWGIGSAGQIVSPTDCWALRRGSVHLHPRGRSGARCSHFLGDGASICIPLIAIGEPIGILAIQDNDFPQTEPRKADFQNDFQHKGGSQNNTSRNNEVRNDDLQNGDAASAAPEPNSDSDHSARRLHLASAVAEHVAVAIANLGLRETLRLQAVRDPLTGLYNRRYMQEFLERELHSARRRHRPVSVMMLDLDRFKRYNDSFGHAAGDRALASVGDILQRSVRAEDIACRYGGEEFTLILPECNLQQANVRAEIIRKRVAESSSRMEKGPAHDVTISIGVAAFDETTDRVDLLLKFADDALYEAKRKGRNRVVQARPASDVPDENFREENSAAAAAARPE